MSDAGRGEHVAVATLDGERQAEEEEGDGQHGEDGDVGVGLAAVVVGQVGLDGLAQPGLVGAAVAARRCRRPLSVDRSGRPA